MPWIHMTDEQRRNCLTFLNRTSLNGTEAEALVSVKMALMHPTADADLVAAQETSDTRGGDNNGD